MSEVEALCALRSCSPGESVFAYGDTGDALYLIAEGEVEVFTNNNAGIAIPLELMSAGAVFGEVALFNGETRTANAKASGATRAVLVRIAKRDVSAALSLCPELRGRAPERHGAALARLGREPAASNDVRHQRDEA